MMKAIVLAGALTLSCFADAAGKPCLIELHKAGAQTVTIMANLIPVINGNIDLVSYEYHEVVGNYFIKIVEADGWYFFNAISRAKKMSVGPERAIEVELTDPGSLVKVNCPEQY